MQNNYLDSFSHMPQYVLGVNNNMRIKQVCLAEKYSKM